MHPLAPRRYGKKSSLWVYVSPSISQLTSNSERLMRIKWEIYFHKEVCFVRSLNCVNRGYTTSFTNSEMKKREKELVNITYSVRSIFCLLLLHFLLVKLLLLLAFCLPIGNFGICICQLQKEKIMSERWIINPICYDSNYNYKNSFLATNTLFCLW